MPESDLIQEFQAKTINVRWPDGGAPAAMTNAFVFQMTPDGVMLTIGQVNPPLPFGTPEQQREYALSIEELPAEVICQVVMTVDRAQEMSKALDIILKQIASIKPGAPTPELVSIEQSGEAKS